MPCFASRPYAVTRLQAEAERLEAERAEWAAGEAGRRTAAAHAADAREQAKRVRVSRI